MKNISLFFLCSFAYVSSVLAQESLFPELSGENEEMVVIETTETENSQPETAVDDKNSEVKQTTQEKQVKEKNTEDESESEKNEEENDKEGKIMIGLDNIKATLTEVSEVSYCSADFVLLNTFKKKTLNNFSVALTIGTKEKKFDFKNIQPLGSTGKSFIMVGENCAALVKMPVFNIQKCQLQGLSEKKCKEKVQYMPIPQNAQ